MELTTNSIARPIWCDWPTLLWNGLKRVPLTTACVLVAVAIGASAAATSALEYDRVALGNGEWWRAATGHFTHWNFDHLFWDLTAFGVLGAYCERRRPRMFTIVLLTSIATISLGLWFGLPAIERYRGLSGLDSALFVLACGMYADDARRRRDAIGVGVAVAAIIAFLGKVAFETVTGSTLFVDAAAAGFTPLPSTHLFGGAAGLIVAAGGLCRGTISPFADRGL